MRYGEAVATGTGGPTAVVSAIRDYLLELADPRYSPSELVMLSEAVTALAQTFSPAAELRWELVGAPYLQVRLVEGYRSDLVALTPSG